MSAAIRVRNLYFMLLYAWELFPEGRQAELPDDEGPGEVNLFARLLVDGVKRLLRRGLAKGYVEMHEETSTPHGRFRLSETLSRATLVHGKAVCSYTQLTVDTSLNRVLKATMRALSYTEGLKHDTAHELRLLSQRLSEVCDIRFGLGMFREVQFNGSSRDYVLLLRLCEFISKRLLPGEGSAQAQFLEVTEDEVTMPQVFEAFLRAFYRVEQNQFAISASHVPWRIEADRTEDLTYIPTMRTDITLMSRDEIIIIDAKYYRNIFRSHRGATAKLRSEHLYQIQSYMKHAQDRAGGTVRGILVYAATGEGSLDLRYRLDGLPLEVVSLNLDRPWAAIANDVLALAKQSNRYN